MGEDNMTEVQKKSISLRDIIGCGYDEWFYNLDNSNEIYKNGMTKSEWAKSIRYWAVRGGRG